MKCGCEVVLDISPSLVMTGMSREADMSLFFTPQTAATDSPIGISLLCSHAGNKISHNLSQ